MADKLTKAQVEALGFKELRAYAAQFGVKDSSREGFLEELEAGGFLAVDEPATAPTPAPQKEHTRTRVKDDGDSTGGGKSTAGVKTYCVFVLSRSMIVDGKHTEAGVETRTDNSEVAAAVISSRNVLSFTIYRTDAHDKRGKVVREWSRGN